MKRIRLIHPSAVLFVGILIAFALPFGYSAAGCGPTTAQYTGLDLLQADVDPGLAGNPDDEKYAREIGRQGRNWAWLLLASALAGLSLAVLKRGKLWATCCAISASIAFGLAVALDFGDTYIGWELAFLVPGGGVALKVVITIVTWLWGRAQPSIAARFRQPAKPAGVSTPPSRPSSTA